MAYVEKLILLPWALLAAAPQKSSARWNGDGKLSRAEFDGLGERWFAEWDAAKSGQVTNEQFGAGMNAMLEIPGPGWASDAGRERQEK